MEVYEKCQLHHSEDFRLSILHPAKSLDAPLEGTLKTERLGQRSFEALSYVWGDPQAAGSLYCQSGPLPITSNLDSALRHLRKKRKHRILWVDAVCINQSDSAEKSHQMPLMRNIYESAKHCLVWLGADQSPEIQKLFRFAACKGALYNVCIGYDFCMWISEKVIGLKFPYEVSADLLARPWFFRLWTYQEVMLNKSPIVVCGQHSIAWQKLDDFSVLDPSSRFEIWRGLSHHHRVQSDANQTISMRFLHKLRFQQVSEPKDKIFGSMAILQGIGWRPPDLTYDMTVADIYTAATRAWLRMADHLSFICLAATARATPGIPTWSIDWQAPPSEGPGGKDATIDFSSGLPHVHCTATKQSRCPIGTAHEEWTDPELRLYGFSVAHVRAFQRTPTNEQNMAGPDGPLVTFDDVQFLANERGSQSMHGILGRFWYTLRYSAIINPLFHDSEDLDVLQKHAEAAVTDTGDVTSKFDSAMEDDPSLVWQRKVLLQYQTLFVTDTDEVGYCLSKDVRCGDSVVLIAGLDYPILLRQSDREQNRYTFVGPAHISGMLEGELWPDPKDEGEMETFVLI